jgi:hypothetical protein
VSARLAAIARSISLAGWRAGVLVGVLAGASVGCYDVPKPDCGFVCGPADGSNQPCPDEYTCADDHRCHRNGTPSSLRCEPPPDAAAPDAAPAVR